MERRKFLIGAGSAAVGASAVIGSGAFSSATADRSVSINTAGDANAFLGIESTSHNDEYVVDEGDGTVALDFTASSGAKGDGLNNDSFTKFNKVLKFTNNGTDPVVLYLENGHPDNPNEQKIESQGFGSYGVDADLITDLAAEDPDNSSSSKKVENGYDNSIFWNFPDEAKPSAYSPFGNDSRGNSFAFGLDDSDTLAPENVNTDIFNRTAEHPYILTPGDSLLQNIQINTNNQNTNWESIENLETNVALVAYTKDFAENDV